jgi:hypothetical protein
MTSRLKTIISQIAKHNKCTIVGYPCHSQVTFFLLRSCVAKNIRLRKQPNKEFKRVTVQNVSGTCLSKKKLDFPSILGRKTVNFFFVFEQLKENIAL